MTVTVNQLIALLEVYCTGFAGVPGSSGVGTWRSDIDSLERWGLLTADGDEYVTAKGRELVEAMQRLAGDFQ